MAAGIACCGTGMVWAAVVQPKSWSERFAVEIKPDIIHLHNILLGYYLNYEVLFDYLPEERIFRWMQTLRDCWPLYGALHSFRFYPRVRD